MTLDITASRTGATIRLGAITIICGQRDDEAGIRVSVNGLDAEERIYEDHYDEDAITETKVLQANIYRAVSGNICEIITRTISGEGDAPRTHTYRYTVAGEPLGHDEMVEFEGGEPGSTITETYKYDAKGEYLESARRVHDAETEYDYERRS